MRTISISTLEPQSICKILDYWVDIDTRHGCKTTDKERHILKLAHYDGGDGVMVGAKLNCRQ